MFPLFLIVLLLFLTPMSLTRDRPTDLAELLARAGPADLPVPVRPMDVTGPSTRGSFLLDPSTRPGIGLPASLGFRPAVSSRRAPPGDLAFGWPLSVERVVRRFDPPPEPWLPGHRGVDLAGQPSSAVLAAGSGTVIYAGVIAGRGVVSLAHPGGLRTTYEPVTPTVSVGNTVSRGSEIGRLSPGHPGCPESACLHWGLRRGSLYLDPLALLGLGRVRLLPLIGVP